MHRSLVVAWVAWLGFGTGVPEIGAQQRSKPPTTARVDLQAVAAVGGVVEGTLPLGAGTLRRPSWQPPEVQARSYTAEIPVTRFAWESGAIRFVPRNSGTVLLSLMGPWEEVQPGTGTLYRQEVLWDDLSVEGTTIVNPSFELGTATNLTGWAGGSVQPGTADVPAIAGSRVARSWHNNPLRASLVVTGGVPVTLRFRARAFVPEGFAEMWRPSGTNTPAHVAAKRFRRGINLGNSLEAPPNTWGDLSYTDADFDLIKAEGFDHVRMPVAWHHYTGPAPEYALSAAIFEKVDALVGRALARNLSVILNQHHFDDLTTAPNLHSNRFLAIWRQVAFHFAAHPAPLALEILNEPKDAASGATLNALIGGAIRDIRAIDSKRTLFVGPGQFNSIRALGDLWLPPGEDNIIVTVHCYDPFLVTHQGASWTQPDTATTGLVFPGPPTRPLAPAPAATKSWVIEWIDAYNRLPAAENPSGPIAFVPKIRRAAEWSAYYRRPIHMGEFGCYEGASPDTRVNFVREFRRALDNAGIGWALWDWKAGFRYIRNGRPEPLGMREALFGRP